MTLSCKIGWHRWKWRELDTVADQNGKYGIRETRRCTDCNKREIRVRWEKAA
jgi:hypothetical protein